MCEGPVGPVAAAVVVGGGAVELDEEPASNFWKRLEWREGALPLVWRCISASWAPIWERYQASR